MLSKQALKMHGKQTHVQLQLKRKHFFFLKKTESRERFDEGRACKILSSVDLKAPIFKCYFQLTFPARV